MTTDLLEYYARRAMEYEAIYAKPERQADLDRVRRWLHDELGGHRVLEIACGTGYWTAWLAPVTETILATDANEEVLDVARQKSYPPGRVSFALADAYELGTVTGEFSAAFAGFFWSHVPRQRIPAFLRNLHERLGQGVRVVLLDNRYVTGSSTPISRRDEAGNTYQQRLADGSEYEVLKNFPSPAELTAALGTDAIGLRMVVFEYYWGAVYDIAEPTRGLRPSKQNHRSSLEVAVKRSNRCPKCGSNDIIADAKAVDWNDGFKRELSVATFAKPDALIFKGESTTTLSAWVCADCGYVELYADSPGSIKVSPPDLE